ncbi:MAG: NUDIX hydrolase [Tissierellia bacterium]|nr:NUDIX hydrolase [Bacillota bacterium]NLL22864.1 NUDIX hydrolase [Tissierellia bacterium]
MKLLHIEEAPLKYLKTLRLHYEDKSGNARVWEMVSRSGKARLEKDLAGGNHTDGPMIVAWNEEKTHVVMIREYRVVAGKEIVTFPAGLCDEGESIKEASIREFKEETGLDFHYLAQEGPRYTSVGLSDEKVHTVYGTFTGELSQKYLEDSELIVPFLVDREEAVRLIKEEEMTVRSAFCLQMFFRIGPLFELIP